MASENKSALRLAKKYSKKNTGAAGGYLVGRKHTQGGIKVKNKSTGEHLEVEGGEVVITAPAVSDSKTLHEFDGKKMTKRQVLSAINVQGGGVAFADGGRVPKKIRCTGKQYKYGGEMKSDYDIVSDCGCKHSGSKKGKVKGEKFAEGGNIPIQDPLAMAIQLLRMKKDLPDNWKNMLKADPEAVVKMIAQQAQNLTNDHKRYANAKDDSYEQTEIIFGKRITDLAVKAFPEKLDKGGQVQRKTLPVTISDNENTNSTAYQHYKHGGMMAKGGKTSIPWDKKADDFLQNIKIVRDFVPQFQMDYLMKLYRSEEKEAAIEIVQRLAALIAKMPKTYGTEKQETNDKIVYLHYFHGGSDWYIVEKDSEPEQLQAFGYVNLGHDGEWGYISIEEIKSIGKIELDFYFEPIAFGELKKKWSDVSNTDKIQNAIASISHYADKSVAAYLSPQQFKKYELNESENYHSENALLLAEATGKSDLIEAARVLVLEHNIAGLLTTGLRDLQYRLFRIMAVGEDKGTKATIPDIAAANPDRIMIVKPTSDAPAIINGQQSTISASKQVVTNIAIRSLVKEKGSVRLLYSAEEIAMLKLYEGMGAEKKTSTDVRILDQFFTPMDIIAKMWGMCFKHGFSFPGSNILEPSVGSGRFISFLPVGHLFYLRAYDVDETCATICKVLYPGLDIRHGSFEQEFFKGRRHIGLAGVDKFYDLVIGNPPYREYVSEYAPLGEKKATGASTFEMYFIDRGVDVLKPGGLLCYIIPNTFLSNDSKYNDFKERLARKADLVDAYRLPNGVFGNTDVGTDIILLRKK